MNNTEDTKNTKEMTITEKDRDILSTVLKLYIGLYPIAYPGAIHFKKEAELLIEEFKKIKFQHKCGWHPMMDCYMAGTILLTPECVMAIIRGLEIYTGGYPNDYSGASIWRYEAESMLSRIRTKYHDFVEHLLDY